MPLEDIRASRKGKIEKLKKEGETAYPSEAHRTHEIGFLLDHFDELSSQKASVTIVGRLFLLREHGGIIFGNLRDASGKIQLAFKKDTLGDKYQRVAERFDIGDIIEVSGTVFLTKKQEKTLEVSSFRILTKTLRPLPEKWHGLIDVEERLRRRYVDLMMSPETQELFIKKSLFWQTTREFLLHDGFLEMETPVLEQVPGGADAEPFITHMKALDLDFYLRISPELHLKRLLVGGFEKVFEIGRIFRNEGIDREHLQDYTQMEMYWAYADYKKLMKLVEELVKEVIQKTLGSLRHEHQGHVIDWSGSWEHIDYMHVFQKETGIDVEKASERELVEHAKKVGIDVEKHFGRGRLIDVLFNKKVRPTFINPTFLVLPPVAVEPLAKRSREHPDRVERFQIVAGGTELGKGFSELNDPLDQRARFEEQMELRRKGDKEAQMMDEDFVEALEYGMPPAAGFAYSERLFAFLMDKSVRETVLFPLMRPKEHHD